MPLGLDDQTIAEVEELLAHSCLQRERDEPGKHFECERARVAGSLGLRASRIRICLASHEI
jgi:hypothetical protein